MKEKLYRFTLAFDRQPQDIGILQGLEDTGIDASVSQEFYKNFETLPCPLLETPDDSPVECWFREKGLLEFRDALNEIIYELSCVNWQVLGQMIEEDMAQALYVDDFQVAYAATYLETDKTKFKEVGSIRDTAPYINYLFRGVMAMKNFVHWLKIDAYSKDEDKQYYEIQSYLEKYPEAKATLFTYDSGNFNKIVRLECHQCYNDLDIDVNSFSTNLQRLNKKPNDISERGPFSIPPYIAKRHEEKPSLSSQIVAAEEKSNVDVCKVKENTLER